MAKFIEIPFDAVQEKMKIFISKKAAEPFKVLSIEPDQFAPGEKVINARCPYTFNKFVIRKKLNPNLFIPVNS